MIDFIKAEQAYNQFQVETEENFVKSLLVNEIGGVMSNFYIIKSGRKHSFKPLKSRTRVVIFLSNSGIVSSDNNFFELREMAVMAWQDNSTVKIEAKSSPIELIEILMDLTPDDVEIILKTNHKGIYFKNYSEADTYREKIKSTKTVNRTLLPANIIPRMVLGSVETQGPDVVGVHSHPMLEQLFWGLPGNSCLVKADKYEKYFGEKILLHIPLGSDHGVEVEEGKSIHYIWMDFFKDPKGVAYIENTHIADTK